jgi:hypothetical protein
MTATGDASTRGESKECSNSARVRIGLAYQGELAEYEALTEEQRAAAKRPEPLEEPVLSSSFIQPVERFWKLLEDLYPERSTVRIQEFREFQMKPAESMANMVSRL